MFNVQCSKFNVQCSMFNAYRNPNSLCSNNTSNNTIQRGEGKSMGCMFFETMMVMAWHLKEVKPWHPVPVPIPVNKKSSYFFLFAV